MFEINLIGTTRLASDSSAGPLDVGGVKPRQILEVLALRHLDTVNKEQLAEAIWDGRPPSTYAATLESHVSVVRRHLRAHGVPREAILTVHDGYVLTDAVSVDLSRLHQALRDAIQSPTPMHLSRVDAAVPPPEQQLLSSSPYASWAIAAREALDLEIGRALRALAGGCFRVGDLERATTFLERAQQAEPLSELTEQLLLRTLAARGAGVDALVSFTRFRRLLRDEVGAEPSATTLEMHLAVLRGLADGGNELAARERALLRQVLSQLAHQELMTRVSTAPARTPATVTLLHPQPPLLPAVVGALA